MLANFRPVPNLPFSSMILKLADASQLCEYSQSNSLFEDSRSGFRARHSTEAALVKVSNGLTASDCCLFDTIDHHIPLLRMEKGYGIKGSTLNGLRSIR